MKKTITFLICLLMACTGWVFAQQAKLAAMPPAQPSAPKHLYLRGGKTHLILQPTQSGVRVYRQVGNIRIPMR